MRAAFFFPPTFLAHRTPLAHPRDFGDQVVENVRLPGDDDGIREYGDIHP
jgi:hypothetical protein